MELLETLVRGKGLWLHLILVSLLVKGETIAGDRGIHSGAKVGVLLDDVAALSVNLNTLSGLVHLTKHFDTLALNLGKGTLFVLSFLETNFFGALGVLLL